MAVVATAISRFLTDLNLTHSNKLWVAYSGGLDSHVLLHSIVSSASVEQRRYIRAIHINHQLQKQANEWVDHCKASCSLLDIPLTVVLVDANSKPGESPEDAARKARYLAIQEQMNSADILVTGHHLADQSETLILQLMRGSGVDGLAAMPKVRALADIELHRPLLDVPQAKLLEYAKQNELSWVEDPSNEMRDIRRNYVRHEILPIIEKTWPNAQNSIATSAKHLADSKKLITSFLEAALQEVMVAPDCLDLQKLLNRPIIQQRHIIRYWYESLQLTRPNHIQLNVIFEELIHARTDATPVTKLNATQLIRTAKYLILLPDWPEQVNSISLTSTAVDTDIISLTISDQDGTVPENLELRFGNYQSKVVVNGNTKALKKLFKEKAITANLRTSWPQIYRNDELLIVPYVYCALKAKDWDCDFDYKRLIKSDQSLTKIISG